MNHNLSTAGISVQDPLRRGCSVRFTSFVCVKFLTLPNIIPSSFPSIAIPFSISSFLIHFSPFFSQTVLLTYTSLLAFLLSSFIPFHLSMSPLISTLIIYPTFHRSPYPYCLIPSHSKKLPILFPLFPFFLISLFPLLFPSLLFLLSLHFFLLHIPPVSPPISYLLNLSAPLLSDPISTILFLRGKIHHGYPSLRGEDGLCRTLTD